MADEEMNGGGGKEQEGVVEGMWTMRVMRAQFNKHGRLFAGHWGH